MTPECWLSRPSCCRRAPVIDTVSAVTTRTPSGVTAPRSVQLSAAPAARYASESRPPRTAPRGIVGELGLTQRERSPDHCEYRRLVMRAKGGPGRRLLACPGTADLHVRAAGPVAWRSRADLVFLRYRVQGDLCPTHAHGKLVAAGQSLKPGTIRAGSRVSLTFRQAQMPKHRVRRGPCSEPGAEVRAWHGREHLLLVVHRPAAVGGHIGWVVRRDEQRVDVAAGDGQAEVVADESHRA